VISIWNYPPDTRSCRIVSQDWRALRGDSEHRTRHLKVLKVNRPRQESGAVFLDRGIGGFGAGSNRSNEAHEEAQA